MKYKDQKSLFDTFTKRKSEYNFGHIIDGYNKFTEYDLDDPYFDENYFYIHEAKVYVKSLSNEISFSHK